MNQALILHHQNNKRMERIENLYYDKAFLLGNGFDVANNHSTCYSDFIAHQYFKKLLMKDNQLAQFIQTQYDYANWVDIEVELGRYSAIIEDTYKGQSFIRESGRFESEYNDLNEALYWFIDDIKTGTTNPKMEELIHSWKNGLFGKRQERAFFVTFNYLRWDSVILQDKLLSERFVGNYPLYIHGMTQYNANATPNIVLGVDEKTVHCKEHHFIVKAYNKYNKADVYFKHIYNANHITIFGCSMGDTDRRYFEPLLSQAKGKTFDIYCYGNKDEMEIKANIAAICQFDGFISNNQVRFIDSTPFSK